MNKIIKEWFAWLRVFQFIAYKGLHDPQYIVDIIRRHNKPKIRFTCDGQPCNNQENNSKVMKTENSHSFNLIS